MTEQEKMEWMLRMADRVAKGNGMINICMMGNQQNIYHAAPARDADVDESECVDENEGQRGADMPPVVSVPSELDTPDMRGLLDQLVEQGVLGEGYQLKNQSWTEKSVIVAFLSGKVGKRCMWSAFAELWACDKNALQSAYSKHCDTMAARKYYQELTHILD